MQRRFMAFILLGCTMLVFPLVTPAQMRQAQGTAKDAVAAPAPEHDLSGVWLITSRAQALSKTPPPFTAEGKARYEANQPGFGPRAVSGGNDPINHCDPMGVPRSLMTDQAMQFVQIPGRTVQFIEWNHTWRDLWTDGRQPPKDPDPKWFGTSVGKWQGDTFVVETVGVDDRTWLDSLGFPHSEAMHIEERYRHVDRDTIELIVTLDDPAIYSKPWVSDKKLLKLQPQQELKEAYCVGSEWEEFNERMRNPAIRK